MVKRLIYLILISSWLLILSRCGYFSKNSNDADVIAIAFGERLYRSDLEEIIPENVSQKDSIVISQNYINNWIKKKVVLHHAKKNLPEEKLDFEQEIEDYKNSLLIYTYEKELINQNLDTNIKKKEIVKYYEENKDNFELKENIIKVSYIKLPLKSDVANKVRRIYRQDDEKSLEELKELCNTHAVNCFLDTNSWLYFNDLLKEIPIKTYNQEEYLRNHRFIEMQDSMYRYFINIKGFKIKNSISPLVLEEAKIRNILINKRKLQIIENMHNEVFKMALENKDFEIYD